MYYLRTKAAVDAIKFTLDNTKKAAPVEVSAEATATAAQPSTAQQNVQVEPMSPQELRQMLEQSRESEDDDCLMCGS